MSNDSCEKCHALHVKQWGLATPPCRTCPKPILLPINFWFWEVYLSLLGQARTAGFGGFVGFDFTAMRFILEAMDVPREKWYVAIELANMLTGVTAEKLNKEK